MHMKVAIYYEKKQKISQKFSLKRTVLRFSKAGLISLIFQKTPLHVASAKGQLEVVKCLIENGADINAGKAFQVKLIS